MQRRFQIFGKLYDCDRRMALIARFHERLEAFRTEYERLLPLIALRESFLPSQVEAHKSAYAVRPQRGQEKVLDFAKLQLLPEGDPLEDVRAAQHVALIVHRVD